MFSTGVCPKELPAGEGVYGLCRCWPREELSRRDGFWAWEYSVGNVPAGTPN